MNTEAAGCFACKQEIPYSPISFEPTNNVSWFWYSLTTTQQGILVAAGLLFATFVVAPILLKRKRRR